MARATPRAPVVLPTPSPRWEAAQQRGLAHRTKQRCVGTSCSRSFARSTPLVPPATYRFHSHRTTL
ncbi:hypothetical protein AAT19DRAFT_16662 [Rhodotorula toruloides]|uniref:Uncharacterized protein n=1 Tax=Rhodotorula toruloides TaxID=5286 RepID=A0A2T0A3Z6_RHOTO|nr:hypothetical protein AAT19DRAFT_16662 [Rhodotorula toruloides]